MSKFGFHTEHQGLHAAVLARQAGLELGMLAMVIPAENNREMCRLRRAFVQLADALALDLQDAFDSDLPTLSEVDAQTRGRAGSISECRCGFCDMEEAILKGDEFNDLPTTQ